MRDQRENTPGAFEGGRWRRALVGFALLAVCVAGASTALSAHERRLVGGYLIVVGFKNEPAFEDGLNAAEVVVVRAADQRPINASAGDIVDLTIEVQLRKREAFDAPVIQDADLEPPSQGFGTLNRYYSNFRPTVDGTYAFRIRGTVSDASAPLAGPVQVDETYVCGAGTQGNGAFNCVHDAETFPKGSLDNRGEDRHGYQDDDSLKPFKESHRGHGHD